MLRSLIINLNRLANFYKKKITYMAIMKYIKLVSDDAHVSEIYTGVYFLNTQKQAHVYVIRSTIYNTHAAN
jgi:hypothetical protein